MSEHTPGPWSVEERYDGARTIAILRDCRPGRSIGLHVEAGSDWVHSPQSADQVHANARLLAVAPDLLDAMKVILEGFEKGIFVRNIDKDADPMWLLGIAVQIAALAKGQQAITKAEGR